MSEATQMDEPDSASSDLLFAWLSPIETHVDQRMLRPKSPSFGSPLVRAKTAITGFKRTFSGGLSRQDYRQRVREAQEACLWLKAAGFPQYVQLFQDGQFPINLSKFQVEKDHRFLEQSAIDALIRRLNILNRCADVMEETHSKDEESDDELSTRALSEQWVFKAKSKKWSRKSKEQKEKVDFRGSDSALARSFSPPTSPSPPMLVSELRGSLTDLDRRVKCFSFLPTEDFLSATDLPLRTSTISNGSSEMTTAEPKDAQGFSTSGGFSEYTLPRTHMDNFAVGILTTFEDSWKKLQKKSHSLPDVFSASQFCNGTLSTSESIVSSASVSVASALDCSKNNSVAHLPEDPIVSVSTPSVNVNGHPDPEDLLVGDQARESYVRSSVTVGSSSPGGSEFEEKSPEFSPKQRVGRVSMTSSTGEPAESISPNVTLDRSSLQRFRYFKWHSFQRAHSFRHAFKPVRTMIPIEELSSGQIGVLKKLSLVRMTSLLELHKSKISISRILKGRRQRIPDCRHKKVFGVPLSVNVKTTGQVLPAAILSAMDHLKRTGLETKGLFRRAAGKARVEQLKEMCESNPALSDFEDWTPYDVADMIKLYFRELPEPLFSSKFSDILISIHENIPEQLRLQTLQSVMLLMPDESREALQCLLVFLKEVSEHSHVHQMDAQNLAVCFAPTIFCLSCANALKPSPLVRRTASFRRNVVSLTPTLATSKEVTDSVSSSQCFCAMIVNCDKLFKVPADMMLVCKFSHLEFGDPVPYHELGRDKYGSGNFHSFVDTCVSAVLKEAHRKFKGWSHLDTIRGVDISYCKPSDGIPLRLWRGVVEIPATTEAVLTKLWVQRHVWDGQVVKSRLMSEIDYRTEVYQYVTKSMEPFTDRDHCVLRSWRLDQATNAYVLVVTSVSHPSADLMAGIRATELAVRYLIEPLEESTRLTYICRVDVRGRSAEYYNTSFGPYLASSVNRFKDSFHELEYLETPV